MSISWKSSISFDLKISARGDRSSGASSFISSFLHWILFCVTVLLKSSTSSATVRNVLLSFSVRLPYLQSLQRIKMVRMVRFLVWVDLGMRVADYARALMTKAQVICARSKENIIHGLFFDFFMTSTGARKAKLTVNFLAFPRSFGEHFLNLAEL